MASDEVSGKNEKTRSSHHPDLVGAGAGHRERRGHRDEERRETNRRRETGERREAGEQRAGVFVRRREQGETFVRQRKKEWRSAAWESGEAGRIGI